MKRCVQGFVSVVLLYAMLALVTPYSSYLLRRSVEHQINYLNTALSSGQDDVLQQRYPEGKIFSNALLALSVVEYSDNTGRTSDYYAEIVDACISRIFSDEALSNFDPNLEVPYGIFFNGWASFVSKTYAKSTLFEHSKIPKFVQNQGDVVMDRILEAIKSSTCLLPSYGSSVWPADNIVAATTLTIDSLRSNWISCIYAASDSPYQLINHSSDQKVIVRGSSSALMLYFLLLLDIEADESHDLAFQRAFVDNYGGLQLVAEFPDRTGNSDYDSGPLFLGYGTAATIMNIKLQSVLRPRDAKMTWAIMNMVALPINMRQRKFFLGKKEPMLDLFLLWSSVRF